MQIDKEECQRSIVLEFSAFSRQRKIFSSKKIYISLINEKTPTCPTNSKGLFPISYWLSPQQSLRKISRAKLVQRSTLISKGTRSEGRFSVHHSNLKITCLKIFLVSSSQHYFHRFENRNVWSLKLEKFEVGKSQIRGTRCFVLFPPPFRSPHFCNAQAQKGEKKR